MKVHDFDERLSFGENQAAFCLVAFPRFFGHGSAAHLKDDMASQKLGRDWRLKLGDGRIIYLDTKIRETDYPDILLEYVSSDLTGSLGWIEKNLKIDFLLYGFLRSRKVFLFPWYQLREAWKLNGEQWKRTYKKITARNGGYNTLSVAVPTGTLMACVEESKWSVLI